MLLAAAGAAKTLPLPTRAAAMMAILGIALVGLLFVVVILLGGHWVRRQGSPRRGPVVPPDRMPLKTKVKAPASTDDSVPPPSNDDSDSSAGPGTT
jgi:hypothetical protein